jgi:nucleotide-binding universal stress UspA family protein
MTTFMNRETDGRSVILVGIDFSETSTDALQAAENIAYFAPSAELHLVHALAWPSVAFGSRELVGVSQAGFTRDMEQAREELDKLVAPLSCGISRVTGHLKIGPAARIIVQLAVDISADLVVVGTHGRSGFDRFLFGSVAEKVVRTAPCPVLTVRPKAVPIWEQIEPPCPACVEVQQSSQGARLWCEQHSQHHPRPHTYHEVPDTFGIGTQSFR